MTTFFLTQTNSDLSGGADWNRVLAESPGATLSTLFSVAANSTETSYGFTEPNVPGTSGASGDYTINFVVNIGNNALRLRVSVSRVNSSGVVQATSSETAEQTTSASTLTFTLSNVNLGAWSSGDRLRVNYIFRNTNTMSAQGINPLYGSSSMTVVTPFVAGGPGSDASSTSVAAVELQANAIRTTTAVYAGSSAVTLQANATRATTATYAGSTTVSLSAAQLASSSFISSGTSTFAFEDATEYPEPERFIEVLGAELLFFEIVGEATKTYADTDVVSAGTATGALVGGSFRQVAATSAGVATATLNSNAIRASTFSAASATAVSFSGGARVAATATSAGSTALALNTARVGAGGLTSAGTGVLIAVGQTTINGALSSAGSTSLTLNATRIRETAAASAGVGAFNPATVSLSATSLSAQGSTTVNGVGGSRFASTLASAGTTSAALAGGSSIFAAASLNSNGAAVAALIGSGGTAIDSTLTSASAAVVSFSGQATRNSALSSAGVAAATLNTVRVVPSTATVSGQATVSFERANDFRDADLFAIGSGAFAPAGARVVASSASLAGAAAVTAQANAIGNASTTISGESFAVFGTGPDALRIIRPDATITTSGFTGGFAEIDEEAASDTDFAWGANNTAAVLEVGLQDPVGGTPGPGTTTIRYRIARTNNGVLDGGGNAVSITVSLVQGTTVIASDVARATTGAWVTYEWALDASAITDWTDVRLRFTTTASAGTVANRRGGAVSWAEAEIPNAVLSSVVSADLTGAGSTTLTFATATIRTSAVSAAGQATVVLPAVRINTAAVGASGTAATSLNTATVRNTSANMAGAGFAQWLARVNRDAELAAQGVAAAAFQSEAEVGGSVFAITGFAQVEIRLVAVVPGDVQMAGQGSMQALGLGVAVAIDLGPEAMERGAESRSMERGIGDNTMNVASDDGLERPSENRTMEVLP